MRWIIRLAVFVLTISVGASAWYILGQGKPEAAAVAKPAETVTAGTGEDSEPAEALPAVAEQFLKVESPGPVPGFANGKRVVLREGPDRGSTVVAKLKTAEFEPVEILGSTRDFLRVRFTASYGGELEREQDYEGWVEWGAVAPNRSAVILDAETGEVSKRLPLVNYLSSVSYSPDGSRAIFYGGSVDAVTACEAQTEDYAFTRCFTPVKPATYTFFYSPADGSLYAAAVMHEDYDATPAKLNIMRVGAEGETEQTALISTEAEDFVLSPDGLTGFLLRRRDKDQPRMEVDVLDLTNFQVRNTFTLEGDSLPQSASSFVINHDGSELYIELFSEVNAVTVIDTRTGNPVRILPYVAGNDYWYIDRPVGDYLLVKGWLQGEDEMHGSSHAAWLGKEGRRPADKDIDLAIKAGGAGVAVNEGGTRLYKLDADNRVSGRLTIERPELRWGDTGLTALGLSAGPGGNTIVMFVGIIEGC